ncbi:hypothetical protein [Nonomuraea salmonea]|uniref:hypothetical protein n=1 Tax=Nonomuraea salmonea TaxID=46181 RepID=UPI003CD0C300
MPKDRLDRWLRPLRRWCPDPERRISHPGVIETGANRAGKAMAVAMRGLLTHDARLVRKAKDAVSDLLRLTRGGRATGSTATGRSSSTTSTPTPAATASTIWRAWPG